MARMKDVRVSGEATIFRVRRSQRVWFAAAAILVFFYLAVSSLVGDSPTMDEQNHIARGLAILRTGDPRLSLEHPPLVNGLSALPLLSMPEIRLPTDHPSWERREGWYEFADLMLWAYGNDTTRIVFLARLPIVCLALATAMVGYWFAGRLWGGLAGIAALLLFLFEPNLLAHGRYATTDSGATLFTFLTTVLLWRLWAGPRQRRRQRWFIAAVAMGLAFGSKLSAIAFVPIWCVLALLPIYVAREESRAGAAFTRLAQVLSAGLFALLIVWAVYAFEWRAFQFTSEALRPLNDWSGPMPTFWSGLEQIVLLGSGGRSPSFLLGQFSEEGFPFYFVAAFLVKTPLVLIVLLLLAVALLFRSRNTRHKAVFLIITPVMFYLIAMQSALNIGYRHVLPALP